MFIIQITVWDRNWTDCHIRGIVGRWLALVDLSQRTRDRRRAFFTCVVLDVIEDEISNMPLNEIDLPPLSEDARLELVKKVKIHAEAITMPEK